jgi:hypothetical protein
MLGGYHRPAGTTEQGDVHYQLRGSEAVDLVTVGWSNAKEERLVRWVARTPSKGFFVWPALVVHMADGICRECLQLPRLLCNDTARPATSTG